MSGLKQMTYELQPEEDWAVLPDGRLVVAGPNSPPKIIDAQGTTSLGISRPLRLEVFIERFGYAR